MLTTVGYVIASLIFIVIVVLISNMLISRFGKEMDKAMGKNLLKDLNRAILNEGRKFLPIQADRALAVIILIVMIILYWLNLKYLIK